jgi:transglutaminase-like putative cysteine protease
VITVFDKKGEDYARLSIGYDQFTSVQSVNIVLFDQSGNQIRKVKQSEIKDESCVPGGTLYSDSRQKIYQSYRPLFPYTIEYNYTLVNKSLFYSPMWFPQDDLYISLERASFQVKIPVNIQLRFLEKNLPLKGTMETEGHERTYNWVAGPLVARTDEPYSVSYLEIIPFVQTAPVEFSYGKFPGNMATWSSLGEWLGKLNAGTRSLTDDTRQRVHALTDTIQEKTGKIEALYKFMQSRTRYVSIQIGAGGWQPSPAVEVDKTGYGDCKALSNYMIALLEEAGINASYVVILAGEDAPEPDLNFPSRRFNHAIVCVPLDKDTIWLECTSQTMPFGYLGDFTDNRYALAVMNGKAEIVRTPEYDERHNRISLKADFTIDPDGSGMTHAQYRATGISSDGLYQLHSLGVADQKKQLDNLLDLPDYEIVSHSLAIFSSGLPEVKLELDLQIDRYASISGSRMFIPLNRLDGFSGVPRRMKSRSNGVEVRRSASSIDSIHFILPSGFEIEFLPPPREISSPFGYYSSSVKQQPDGLHYLRTFIRYKIKSGPESYDQLVDFYKEVTTADNEQAVLLKSY